ncbi:hypothetical protein M5K25_006046 [Dendrobium thyrsiflorum]|uniref:Uncharacterized protein n=1 Tax=Dendrobium thyrsiflorum TaxID=117978 RepID=A0ABD0VA86_DENTH
MSKPVCGREPKPSASFAVVFNDTLGAIASARAIRSQTAMGYCSRDRAGGSWQSAGMRAGGSTNAPQQMWFASRANHDFSELQRFTSLQDFAPSGLLQLLLAQLLVSHFCCSVQVSGGAGYQFVSCLVQVSGGAEYQFFGRSRMKMSTSSSGIVGSERSSVLSFLHSGLVDDGILLVQPKALYELWDNFFGPLLRAFTDLLKKNFFDPRSVLCRCVEGFAESLPRFTCSICDAKSGSDSSSSGKYRSSSELQSIGNTIIQDSGAAPLTYSSFTGVLGNTEMTRHTSVGRESASPFSSASPTLSSDIKSANLMGFEEPAWLRCCLEEDACTLGNPFRLSTGSSSEPDRLWLIRIQALFSFEGLGLQAVGPRKISSAHQRSYFSLPTLGQQICSGWEHWLQVPEQADLMSAQAPAVVELGA